MNSQIAEFIEKYIQQKFCLKAIIISASDGMHIFSSFQPHFPIEIEKCLKMSTMLISSFNQINDNYKKIGQKKDMRVLNIYYEKFLIHINSVQNLVINLYLHPEANIVQAK